jgi:SHS2 domain-containing protein
MTEADETPVPGVQGLDHTADVGLEIRGPDLPELFRRAALGAMWLVLDRRPEPWEATALSTEVDGKRMVDLVEEELPELLRSWLRTLLFWEETQGFVTLDARVMLLPTPLCSSADGQAFGLHAEVDGLVDHGPRVREIKGVTFHELCVERRSGEWLAMVIFDV